MRENRNHFRVVRKGPESARRIFVQPASHGIAPALAKPGPKRVERRQASTGVACSVATTARIPVKSLILFRHLGEWCNGSTTDSDSVCLGSNPSSPAKRRLTYDSVLRRAISCSASARRASLAASSLYECRILATLCLASC